MTLQSYDIKRLTILYVVQYYGFARRCIVIDNTEAVKNLVLELRRGVLSLSVLSQLSEPQYGYSLLQRLTELGMEIDQSTLYPLLRRLEQQDLLMSDWSLEGSRPRRYYVLSQKGQTALQEAVKHWHTTVAVMDRMLADKGV